MNSKFRQVCEMLAREQMVSAGISGTYETLAGNTPLFRNAGPEPKPLKKKIKKHYGKRKIPLT